MNKESAYERREHLYSQAEMIEAEIDSRIDALQDYIALEEAEVKELHYQALKLVVQARDLEEEFNLDV